MNAKSINVRNANLFECDYELGALARKSWLAEQACVQDAYDFLDFWFFSSCYREAEIPPQRGKRTNKNPGKDFVILGYQLDKESQGMIEIRDISGTLMHSIPINGMQDQLTLVTTNWKPGIYMLSLVLGDKVIETTKFTLVH